MRIVVLIVAALSAVQAVPTKSTFLEEFVPLTIIEEQQQDQYDQHQTLKQQSSPWSASEYLKNALSKPVELVTTKDLVTDDVDVVSKLRSLGLNRAADIADRVKLNSLVQGLDYFTLFAPTDVAVDALDQVLKGMKLRSLRDFVKDKDLEILTKLCKSWVVPWPMRSYLMDNDMTVDSVGGTQLRFNQYKQKKTVNGAEITKFDVSCGDRGLVHVTNRTIYPLPDGTIRETLKKVPQFTVFEALLSKTNIQLDDSVTMLIPTNKAFYVIDGKTVSTDIFIDEKKRTEFIKRHIISGTWYSAGLTDGQSLQTANHNPLTVQFKKDRICINSLSPDTQPELIIRDIPATNGVMHVINHAIGNQIPSHLTW